MIRIVQYGLGNVGAFANIYHRLNIACATAETAADLADADKIILPGVGSFDWAMKLLNESSMRERLDELVLEKNVPVLGVCVGMQMMARSSDEGKSPGLGWIDANVRRFDTATLVNKDRLPHMGWSTAVPRDAAALFAGLAEPKFYFLHSYYFAPNRTENALAQTHFGIDFVSACQRDNILGVQFHPEKSHDWGIRLLKNFAEL